MNPITKEKWLTLLRSGQYIQGRGLLLDIDHAGKERYCCLGLFCVAAGLTPTPAARMSGAQTLPGIKPMAFLGSVHTLHLTLAQDNDIGVRGELPFDDRTGNKVALTSCNDELALPFSQIADLVECFF